MVRIERLLFLGLQVCDVAYILFTYLATVFFKNHLNQNH